MGIAVTVDELSKFYGDFIAVDKVSFDVRQGEIFGLLGPNGAGKTSTLECLEGLRKPSKGRLNILGVNPVTEAGKLRNLIGVQLQSSGLPASITVEEAMKFFCAYHGIKPRFDLLQRMSLGDKLKTQYQALSTGGQRRLALSLAVAHSPKVLFLDEPTAGLDVASRATLHELMGELKDQGVTIILSTHDMAEAEEMSDRVAIMLRGKVVAVGTPREITATGSGVTRISLRTQANSLAQEILPAVINTASKDNYILLYSADIEVTLSAIMAKIRENGDTLIDLRVERPTLEERFLELTREVAS